jgi:hypothetical protein
MIGFFPEIVAQLFDELVDAFSTFLPMSRASPRAAFLLR